MAKGISGSGQGFDAASKGRLGSHSFIPTHNPPETQLKNVMLKVHIALNLVNCADATWPRHMSACVTASIVLKLQSSCAAGCRHQMPQCMAQMMRRGCFEIQLVSCEPGLWHAIVSLHMPDCPVTSCCEKRHGWQSQCCEAEAWA